jgi:MoxR-like ATPase
MELPDADVQTSILLAHAQGKISDHDGGELLTRERLLLLQDEVDGIFLHPSVAAYITALGDALRRLAGEEQGVSVRALLNLMQAARAKAFLEDQREVHPDHVQTLFPAVMRHRLTIDDRNEITLLIQAALEQTPVP